MSSLYVRRKTRDWCRALSHGDYVDSINVYEDINGIDVAITADFNPRRRQRTTFCGDVLETGLITLTWIGRTGQGDEALITAVEADAAVFYKNIDPAGKMALINMSAPETFNFGSNTPRFAVDVSFEYEFNPT